MNDKISYFRNMVYNLCFLKNAKDVEYLEVFIRKLHIRVKNFSFSVKVKQGKLQFLKSPKIKQILSLYSVFMNILTILL